MRNSRVRNWHYRRLAEGSGRATVSNSSFCWGVMADKPEGVYAVSCGTCLQPPSIATAPSRIAARVDGAVKGGRSPAKRTLYSVRNANTLKGLGLVAASRGQLPSPSGGEDFPALAAGLGVGRPKGSAWGPGAPFHTKRTKPAGG